MTKIIRAKYSVFYQEKNLHMVGAIFGFTSKIDEMEDPDKDRILTEESSI